MAQEDSQIVIRKLISQWFFRFGSAHIHLILDKKEFTPGERVTGYFSLEGGWFEQEIKRLECDLVVTDKQNQTEQLIQGAVTRLMSKSIESKESDQIPFTFLLPDELDSSSGSRSYRFHTRVVFSNGAQSVEHDEIKIWK
ncbi:sporulation protein [Bacillus badius]|nr:sporulation protein [Bacillus badius]